MIVTVHRVPEKSSNLRTSFGPVWQEKYSEVQPLRERALAINEAALGADHHSTIESRGALGNLYKKQGLFDKARLLLEEVVNTLERVHGPDHPRVADALMKQVDLTRIQVRATQCPILEFVDLDVCPRIPMWVLKLLDTFRRLCMVW